jgi:hypothetical protein
MLGTSQLKSRLIQKNGHYFISFWLLNVHLSTANFYYVIAQIRRDVVPTGTNTPGEVIKEVLFEFSSPKKVL